MKMNVSIIIINYNTKEITQQCIDSIFKHTKTVTFEVIVVDNNSTDGSKEILSKDNRITYIYNPTNLGFGTANNIGYQHAKGEYIFLLNSDTVLLNDAVSIFYNKIKELPQHIGCLGSMLLDNNHSIGLSYGKFPTIWSSLYHLALCPILHLNIQFEKYFNYKGIPKDWIEVDYITGADIFLKRNIIEEYGLFDSNYFLYYEETDMQKRYSKIGIGRAIIQGPQIIHIEAGSSKKTVTSLRKICYTYTSCFRFLRKWYSPFSYILFKIIFLFTRGLHLLVNPKFTINDKIDFLKLFLR